MKKIFSVFCFLLIGITSVFCAGIAEGIAMAAVYQYVNQIRNQQITTIIIGLIITGIVALCARKHAGGVFIAGIIVIVVICLLLQMQLSGITY